MGKGTYFNKATFFDIEQKKGKKSMISGLTLTDGTYFDRGA